MSQRSLAKRFDRHDVVWAALAVLLTLNIPIFLCQHLTNDAVMFDLQAKCALDGGVLYRDILEPNLPGAVWIHMLVRAVAGWSTYAIRAFDLLVLTVVVGLLWRWTTKRDTDNLPRTTRMAPLAFAIFWFYFSLSEWSHVQRDLWALLPCLIAMHLRMQVIETEEQTPRTRISRCVLEGVLWGTAFWIKPHIAIPATAVLLTTMIIAKRKRLAVCDITVVASGGIFVGAIGSFWLIQTGAWDHFWEMLLDWNPEYVKRGRERMTAGMLIGRWQAMAPWSWAHLPAVITAVVALSKVRTPEVNRQRVLLSAMYLGWMVQVLLLQFPFAYVHVPGIVLAIGLIGTLNIPVQSEPLPQVAFVVLSLFAALISPASNPQRLSNWQVCIREGSTPAVRSALQLEQTFQWNELQPVIEYLDDQNVQDGEVTAYSGALCHIYPRLGIAPSTRYVFLDVIARVFRSRTDEIQDAVENCNHRFVVSSLFEAGMARDVIDGDTDPTTLLPASFPEAERQRFPYTQPVVFRSGQYLVHRVTEPIGPLCTEYLPLAKVPSNRRH
jgi:hypothetical protein